MYILVVGDRDGWRTECCFWSECWGSSRMAGGRQYLCVECRHRVSSFGSLYFCIIFALLLLLTLKYEL
jgi:hypothetical protein